jgi:5-methylcytosine-specific restriction endonuclease McrA
MNAHGAGFAAVERPMTSPDQCEHPRLTEPRRRTLASSQVQYRRQCLDCGKPVGQAVGKAQVEYKADGPIEDFDVALYDRGRALAEAVEEERRAGRRDRYDAYLASDAWQRKRAAVLRRCAGICEGCSEAPAVEVHHLTYEHVGNELLFELVGVCRDCHAAAHAVADTTLLGRRSHGSRTPARDRPSRRCAPAMTALAAITHTRGQQLKPFPECFVKLTAPGGFPAQRGEKDAKTPQPSSCRRDC